MKNKMPEILTSEFVERRKRLAKACEEAGLDGSLVVSQGGRRRPWPATVSTWLTITRTGSLAWRTFLHIGIVESCRGSSAGPREAVLVQTMIPSTKRKDLRIHDDVRADYYINEYNMTTI